MKTIKKLTLITALSAIAFQAQAISFNDVALFAQNNPKTTVAIAAAYGLGVKFNYQRLHSSLKPIIVRQENIENPHVVDGAIVDGYSNRVRTIEQNPTFIQKLSCWVFPFMYGIVAGN